MRYKDAGVDIKREALGIKSLRDKITFARKGIGQPIILEHFAGAVEFNEYALVLCTDGVGSKIMIANAMKKWDTVGIDCIAMNVNDIICVGAEPIAFVDYIAMERVDSTIMAEIGKGLDVGAREANVTIVGGETATLPDMIRGLDLAGTCLGFVKKDSIVTGKDVRKGDVIIGLKSTGPHSNGYTLIRKVLERAGLDYSEDFHGRPLGLVLLEPTAIYVRDVLSVLRKYEVHGLAHITGGGFLNITRVKPDLGYFITDPIRPHKIFTFIQELGDISDDEMYRTFNMGMGFTIIAGEDCAADIVKEIGDRARVVGHVEKGKGVVIEPADVRLDS